MHWQDLLARLPARSTAPSTGSGSLISGAWHWATVTQTSPLRVRLDGDAGPLLVTPEDLVGGLAVGVRVWVQRHGKRVLIIGKPGGGGGGGEPVGSGLIRGDNGKAYRLLSCVIRNAGGSTWSAIEDAGHSPSGLASVQTTATAIRLNYSFTAEKVSSLQVTPDETIAGMGITVGASVGLSSTFIELYRPGGGLGDYVSYDGTNWNSFRGVFTGMTFNAGVLTLQHAAVEPVTDPRGAATARNGTWRVGLGSLGAATTQVQFFNLGADTAPATPTSSMRVWVERFGKVATPLDPATVNPSTGNLWVTGLFEV